MFYILFRARYLESLLYKELFPAIRYIFSFLRSQEKDAAAIGAKKSTNLQRSCFIVPLGMGHCHTGDANLRARDF